MSETNLDVVALGNAIVDVIVKTNDDFLTANNLKKGAMTLIDENQAATLHGKIRADKVSSGGSAANTIAGLASMGGRGGFIGKVSNDELGKIFQQDICSLGVQFETTAATSGTGTACCFVFVTDDAERTMNTYLGACVELAPEDIDSNSIESAAVTYLEGYLWDPPKAKDAFRKAMKIAHAAGRPVAFTLSDAFCVERYRTEFLELVRGDIDILFANEQEIQSLYKVETIDDAVQQVQNCCSIAVLTLGARGSMVVTPKEIYTVSASAVGQVVDTTGAGDLYAAGFLFGYTQGRDLETCGIYGAKAAAEIISHYGARPAVPLRDILLF